MLYSESQTVSNRCLKSLSVLQCGFGAVRMYIYTMKHDFFILPLRLSTHSGLKASGVVTLFTPRRMSTGIRGIDHSAA